MKRLTNDEIAETLLAAGKEDPLWRAIQQVIADEISSAQEQTGSPGLWDRPGALAGCCGGAEALRVLQGKLLAGREEGKN